MTRTTDVESSRSRDSGAAPTPLDGIPLRRFLLIVVLLVLAMTSGAFLAGLQWMAFSAERQVLESTAASHAALVESSLEREWTVLDVERTSVTRSDPLVAALARGDDLRSAAAPLFHRLAAGGVVQNVMVESAAGERLFTGDPRTELDGPIAQRTRETGLPSRGLYRDRDQLLAGSSIPLFERGRLVGIVTLLRSVDPGERGPYSGARVWGDIEVSVRAFESVDASKMPSGRTQIEIRDDREILVTAVAYPLEAPDAGTSVVIETRQDVTAERREQRMLRIGMVLAMTIVGVLLLLLLLGMGGRVFKGLECAIAALERADPETSQRQCTFLQGRFAEVSRLERVARRMHVNVERRVIAEEQARLAYVDLLTGLPNRRALETRLRALGADIPPESCPLLLLNIDQLKRVNDLRGYGVGDELLRVIASRLVECVGDHGEVMRLGGDEFVVLLGSLGSRQLAYSQATTWAERLVDVVRRPIVVAEGEHRVDASIGITLGPEPEGTAVDSAAASHTAPSSDTAVVPRPDPQNLLRQVDVALHHAKRAGRGRWAFFEHIMHQRLRDSVAIERRIRAALDHDSLRVLLQPQVDRQGRWVGCEGLLRMGDEGSESWTLAQVLQVAETSGLILPLGLRVLRHACEILSDWAGRPGFDSLVLSVNVSALQLQDEAFPRVVERLLASHDIRPGQLRLELTESVMLASSNALMACFQRLRAAGVEWSIDDFGTGYSSLAYLKRLPLHELKVDRAFVQDLLDDPSDAVIVRATITLAHELGLEVVAEGVENEQQAERLREYGADRFQGFLYARPLERAEFERHLTARL